MFTISSLIIFSSILLSSEFVSLSNFNYNQLVNIFESKKPLLQQQRYKRSTTVDIARIGDNDAHPRDDVNSTIIDLFRVD